MLRLRRSTIAFAAVLVLAPGCDGTDPCSEGPGIDGALASAERWVRVVSLLSAPDGEGTEEVGVDVASVGPGLEEEPPDRETIAVHSEHLDDIEEGLRAGESVYLAMASEGLEREAVSYVVRLRSDATVLLGGDECMAEGEAFLRDRLGDGFDAAITSVIGLGDREQILERLAPPAEASASP